MRTGLDHISTLEDQNAVGVPHRRQAMGDDDRGSPLCDAVQGALDGRFGFVVNR